MTGQLMKVVFLAVVMALSQACATTETPASQHETERDKNKEAAETLVQLGVGYLRKGNRQRARINLLKALEKNQRSGDAHNALALLLQMEGESALAEEHFKRAIAYEPELTRLRYNYSIFLLAQKRYDDALEQFSITAEDINYERRGHVFFNIGLIAKQQGKVEEAQQAWEKAILLTPDLAGPFLELADIYFTANDYPKAKRYLDRYEGLTRPSPRALWLAVQLEYVFANKDGEASKALALRNLFPYSQETLEYKAWLKSRDSVATNTVPTTQLEPALKTD